MEDETHQHEATSPGKSSQGGVFVVCKNMFNSNKLKRQTEIHIIPRCPECGKNYNSLKEMKLHKHSHKTKHTEVDVLT